MPNAASARWLAAAVLHALVRGAFSLRGLRRASRFGGRESCGPFRFVTPLDFEAVGDGVTDDTAAVLAAFREGSRCTGVLLPRGKKFLVTPGEVKVTLRDTLVQLAGELVGPSLRRWNPGLQGWPEGSCAYGKAECPPGTDPESSRSHWALLHLVASRNVTVSGGGLLSAPGEGFWRVRNVKAAVRAYCLLKVERSKSINLSSLRLVDSPLYHVVVASSQHVRLEHLRVTVNDRETIHDYARNTDGISIGPNSTDIVVQDCDVASGDDNLVVKGGSRRVLAKGLVLRRGKGLSIGSLGERRSDGTVQDCRFENVTMLGTMFGARIKTWRGGRGAVQNVTFAGVHVRDVLTPIMVDQEYCPVSQHPGGCKNEAGHVQLAAVRFQGVEGTFSGGAERDVRCKSHCDLSFAGMQLARRAPAQR